MKAYRSFGGKKTEINLNKRRTIGTHSDPYNLLVEFLAKSYINVVQEDGQDSTQLFKIILTSSNNSMAKALKLNNGTEMPIVGLGTWQSPKDEVQRAVRVALDTGYRHIDTAYNYQNEDAIGEVLDEYLKAGKVKRSDLYIVTKLPGIHMTPAKVRQSLEGSLKRLKVEYVDLYLIHSPMGMVHVSDDTPFPVDKDGNFMADNSTDLLGIWKEMEKLVDAKLTRSIGVSNHNSEQIDRICKMARIKPVTNQVECHLYYPNADLAAFCKKRGVTITAYAPIGSPGRPAFFSSVDIPRLIDEPTVVEVAKKYKKTSAQVLLRALIQKGIAVIPKSVTPERIKENFNVFDFNIQCSDMKKLDNIKHYDRTLGAGVGKGHPEYPFAIPF